MKFDDFVGMDAQIARLRQGVSDGQSVHAYMFLGDAGTGKRALADVFARAMNCTATVGKPCDACASCGRYLAGTHPDMIRIMPVERKTIGVDDIRQLIERVSRTPYEGAYHTVVVEQADKLTVQAQNALLKTLEEPPASALFILIAQTSAPILTTVMSRVRLVRFAPLTDRQVLDALARRGYSDERARELARCAHGAIGRALRLDADAEYWKMRERVFQALKQLRARADVGYAAMPLVADKDRAQDVLSVLEEIGRARLIDQPNDGIAASGDRLLRGAMEARRMLDGNVSWQSALETLFFKLVS